MYCAASRNLFFAACWWKPQGLHLRASDKAVCFSIGTSHLFLGVCSSNSVAFVTQTKMSQWIRSLACVRNIETSCKRRKSVWFWCDAGLSEIVLTRPMVHGRAADTLKSIFMLSPFCFILQCRNWPKPFRNFSILSMPKLSGTFPVALSGVDVLIIHDIHEQVAYSIGPKSFDLFPRAHIMCGSLREHENASRWCSPGSYGSLETCKSSSAPRSRKEYAPSLLAVGQSRQNWSACKSGSDSAVCSSGHQDCQFERQSLLKIEVENWMA